MDVVEKRESTVFKFSQFEFATNFFFFFFILFVKDFVKVRQISIPPRSSPLRLFRMIAKNIRVGNELKSIDIEM